ncbi:MAG TPA: hypothetical protein VKU82_08610, partial [Planctomycetaceae bacterium]|nr:hypothetical protein [Planctomycetaceae bacterium]
MPDLTSGDTLKPTTYSEQRLVTAWTRLNRKIVRCAKCPRLREYCRNVAEEKRRAFRDWEYWGGPVPNFGDARARMLIVGLAP